MRIFLSARCKSQPVEKYCFLTCQDYRARSWRACERRITSQLHAFDEDRCESCHTQREIFIHEEGEVLLNPCDCGKKNWSISNSQKGRIAELVSEGDFDKLFRLLKNLELSIETVLGYVEDTAVVDALNELKAFLGLED